MTPARLAAGAALAATLAALAASPCRAQDAAPGPVAPPAPSADPVPTPASSLLADPVPGRWTVDAGLALRERPDHIGSRSYTADAWPVVEIQYGSRLHVSLDDGIKWSAVKAGPFAFGPVAEYRQAFNDKLPPRTEKLSDAWELGGFVQADTGIGVFEARLRHAVSGYDGNSADLAFDTGAALAGRLAWTFEARTSWVDRDYLRRAVGGRHGTPLAQPQEHTQDYVTTGAQLGLAYAATSRTTFTTLVSEDRLLSHVPSSFSGSRDLLGLSLVITHRWGGRTF